MNIQSTQRAFNPRPQTETEAKAPSKTGRMKTMAGAAAGKALDTMSPASKALDRNPLLGAAFTTAGAAVRSFRAFPEIIYPTIYGATPAEKAQIIGFLDEMPLHHVSGVRSIRMVPEIHTHKENWIVNGRAHDLDVTNRIQLSRKSLTTPEKLQRTLIHEVGHTVDYETQTFDLYGERSTKEPFGTGPHISEYAKTNNREDFAESFEEYYVNPEKLKETAPEKYEALREMDQQNFMERLVDRKEFRETGKYMSETFAANEWSRHATQGAYYASSFLQSLHGVSQWTRSDETGDRIGHAAGVLNTATGLAFASGISPLVGMSLQGSNHALQSAVRRGALSDAEVESTVTTPVKPIEAMFGRELAKIEDDHRPAKVLAVAAGGALGGTIGSLAGPYAGVIAGYHLAGGMGGAIGMVAGGMLGFLGGAELGGRLAERLVRA